MTHLKHFICIALLTSLVTACGGETTAPSLKTGTSIPPKAKEKVELTQMERGAKLYLRCRSCHTLGEGEKHKVGPNLYGVFGSVAGSKKDFNYSKAMRASDITWSDDTLEAYLKRPRDYIPGNRMSFIGIKNEDDRAAIIAYMKTKTE